MDTKEHIHIPVSKPSTPETSQPSGTGRIVLLAAGDILVFIIFAVIGMRSHKVELTVPSVLQTAAPFALGWFLVSPFIGAFRRGVTRQASKMSLRTVLAWIAAWPIGLLLRGIINHEVPPVSFAVVTLITNALFLQVWRVPFAWLTGRKNH